MYESYFKFEKSPFKVVPDPSMLFASHSVREAMSRLEFAVRTGKGITVMTGEVGTGKTTLLHALLARLERDVQAAFIFNPRLEPLDFFRMLFDEYGIETPCATKAEYLLALNRFLIERLERDLTTLLIVDEAQNLSAEMLEEIRLLSNLETPRSKLLQIMLVGQPELAHKLAQPELRQLRQRIVLRHHLRPFDEKEMQHYIDERLRLAGYTPRLIDSGCCGMAGSFGFEAEHYEISRAMGALRLFPAVEDAAPSTQVVITGVSCRQQIGHFTSRKPRHAVELLADALA